MHLATFLGLLAGSCSALAADYKPCGVTPPQPGREFRGAWVATVDNIDWPSSNSLSTAQQKAELLAILDRAVQLRLNGIVFQVRPACDALYASKIEPWSEYLTGGMGKPPQPYYDPLAFAVEEAHKRCLELHAWFNPYRAHHSSGKSPISSTHISRTHPELVKHYGKDLWLDPGEREVQDYSLRVVMDVVNRYDIDGVHFDDYFYPYAVQDASGNDRPFPDDASWQHFGIRSKLSREDWRRDNVDVFIQRVYKSIKEAKPWVKFGVSPFGIWRPGHPAQIRGYDSYARLYADSRKWLANGWVDYFAPQLYWSIEAEGQSFPVLLKWWTEHNPKKRLIWPGMNTVNTGRRWRPDEIVHQIELTRKQPGASGHIHWDMTKGLMRGNAMGEALIHGVYPRPALVPACTWLWSQRLAKPQIAVGSGERGCVASWQAGPVGQPWLWLLQTRTSGEWTTEILPRTRTSRTWTGAGPQVIAVSAVDRMGNASPSTAVELRK